MLLSYRIYNRVIRFVVEILWTTTACITGRFKKNEKDIQNTAELLVACLNTPFRNGNFNQCSITPRVFSLDMLFLEKAFIGNTTLFLKLHSEYVFLFCQQSCVVFTRTYAYVCIYITTTIYAMRKACLWFLPPQLLHSPGCLHFCIVCYNYMSMFGVAYGALCVKYRASVWVKQPDLPIYWFMFAKMACVK